MTALCVIVVLSIVDFFFFFNIAFLYVDAAVELEQTGFCSA